MFCLFNHNFLYFYKFFYKNLNIRIFYNNKNLFLNLNKNSFNRNNKYTLSSNFMFKFNKKNYFIYNFFNLYNLNKINKVINSLFSAGGSFLFIDLNSKFLTPLINYMFGFKNFYSNKDFFLMDKKNLTRKSWNYSYISFLNKNKIDCLIFLDYLEFSKFFYTFSKFNLPIISLVPSRIKPVYIDYYIFVNNLNLNISKIIIYNFICSCYFKSYNIILYKNKKIFLKIFFRSNNII